MVRRVAANEGEEMLSDDADDQAFSIPAGHCWVLADNEDLAPPDVIDSRSFGPLPFSRVLGRILYAARSRSDHGLVENSEAARRLDTAVLQGELDLDKLCKS